jgi:Replication-relaxation
MNPFTEREETLLGHLRSFRYLTHAQIVEFLFADSALQPKSREITAYQLLRALRQRGLVTSNARAAADPDGAPTRIVYFLTAQGLRAAGAVQGDRRRAGTPRGSLLVAHSLMVADIAIAFRRSALAEQGHALRTWQCDWQFASWLSESYVLPDARFEYTTAHHEIYAFVEADRGTEGTRFFRGKIERYVALYKGARWRATLPFWPFVLTVTPTSKRAVELQRATESVLAIGSEERIGAAFRFTALVDLREFGPFASIWRVAGRTGSSPMAEVPADGPPLIKPATATVP